MTAEEFYKNSDGYPLPHLDGIIMIEDEHLFMIMEQYHEAKTKAEECKHNYEPHSHPAVSEFDRCTKCGKIN